MKKAVVLLVILAVVAPVGVFAQNPFDYEATVPGDLNLNAGVSIGWGIGVDVGVDLILGKFAIEGFPLDWGIGARGLANLGFGGGFNWGAAGLWTLHKGFTLGDKLNFDFYIAVGAGVGGYTGGYFFPFGVGFATFDGLAWKLNDTVAIQIEYGGIYGWQVSTSVGSVGIRLTL
jgi:hypothetical protein